MDTKFKNTWNIWFHHTKDDWSIDGYRKIYTIETISDFWKLYNNWDKLGGINSKHFFIMKNDITPMWEDEENKNGGCWSFKIQEKEASKLWEELSLYLVSETISKIDDDIQGLSICLKKNNHSIIKIWNKDTKNNNNKNINDDIINKYYNDIIYIAHMPEK